VLTRSVKERNGGGVERKGAVTMGGVLYNDVAEGGKKFGAGEPGQLREGGRDEGCHAAGEDVGGPASTDGERPDRQLSAGGVPDVGIGEVGCVPGGPPAIVPSAGQMV
jgi:hypothetical protein